MAASLSSLRLLILSPPPCLPYSPSPFPSVLHALTGFFPTQDQGASGFAGYTQHPPLRLRTKYYDADVAIWCDEVPLPLSLVKAKPKAGLSSDGAIKVSAASDLTTETEPHHDDSQPSVEAGADDLPSVAVADKDALADTEVPPSLSTWRSTMLSEAAREVREAIGGIVLLLPLPLSLPSASELSAFPSKQRHSDDYLDVIEAVAEVRDLIEDEHYGRDVPAVVMVTATGKGVGEGDLDPTTNRLEEFALEERGVLGWEFVGWNGQVGEDAVAGRLTGPRNEFGELMGVERVRELLEAVDWSGPGAGLEGKDLDLDFLSHDEEDGAPGVDGIKLQGQELEREMMGLKLAMRDRDPGDDDDVDAAEEHGPSYVGVEEDEDLKIDQLPGLLERVVAIREAGSEMNKADREKFAKTEVERIMKELT